uniref:Transmembrane protein 218 n=1 Tax=Tetraselmis chuii TaxID=63592 RepID=A0A7S1SSW3_9CHLO|mmetsp:Transcript_27010/g.48111  ORF Transcript_27010/g.48111 Transcript_27010/m.48111 type:complete len:161 (+) Transcript_27010:404-886(+)
MQLAVLSGVWLHCTLLAQASSSAAGAVHNRAGRHLLQTSTWSAPRVVGVGPGVFVLIFFSIVLGTACIIFSKTKYKGAVYASSIVTYTVLLLVLFVTPRGERTYDNNVDVYDWSLLWMSLLGIAMILGVLMSFVGFMLFVASPPMNARKLNEYRDILRIR